MQFMLITDARKNLAKIIDAAIDGEEPTVITRPGGKAAVILSYDEYSSMRETFLVLGNRENTRRLMDSLDEADRGQFVELEKPTVNNNDTAA